MRGSQRMVNDEEFFQISDEIVEAIESNRPVVTLETAVLTHGLPFPYNVENSINMEKIIRKTGAIPATVGIIDGVIKVGLSISEIEKLGTRKDVSKVSLRDIPEAIMLKKSGGTTVSSTVFVAKKNKLKIMVTGGIGGVHRGIERGVLDISQDLGALSNYGIVVVSSGIKAVLDIAKTLEIMETLSIPIIGYKTVSFPAFYSSDSPYELKLSTNSLEDLISFIRINLKIWLNKGILVVNPPPIEASIPFFEIEEIIKKATEDAFKDKIFGQKLTPYLLNKVSFYTANRGLYTNLELLKSNSELGGRLAVELYRSYQKDE